VAWAIRGRPLAGESVSGDAALVVTMSDRTLIAVVDGLGHGPEAHEAAKTACATLEENAAEPLEPLIVLCHQALHRTRGAAISLAAIDHPGGELQWLGIGNVEAVVVRAAGGKPSFETVFHFPGVVGYRLPKLRVPVVRLEPGDLIVLATDGIATDFLEDLSPRRDVDGFADHILDAYGRSADDALVLVARYEGAATA
jgi:serine/threonine protein phosphatase PrpC